MKISIIISTYNGEKYIVQQLESIRNQTKQADEVIISDDCSTDNTVDKIKGFINNNNLDWNIVVNKENQGWKKNFVDLIDKSSGDIVFLCDQDDIWHPYKLEIMSNTMNNHSNIELLVSDYIEIINDEEIVQEDYSRNLLHKMDSIIVRRIIPSRMFFTVAYPGCTYCVRKSFYEKIKKYWRTDFPHDAFLWRFSIFSDSLYCIDLPLFYWRKHSMSEFALESIRKKKLIDRIAWVDYAMSFVSPINEYLSEGDYSKVEEKKRLIKSFDEWLKLRKDFFVSKNPIKGICLIRYLHFYRDFKQYMGDIYTVYIRG